jgi:hypothetical protein
MVVRDPRREDRPGCCTKVGAEAGLTEIDGALGQTLLTWFADADGDQPEPAGPPATSPGELSAEDDYSTAVS